MEREESGSQLEMAKPWPSYPTLHLNIADDKDVRKGMGVLVEGESRFTYIKFSAQFCGYPGMETAALQIGDKGNEAVKLLAPTLAASGFRGKLEFSFCNLNEEAGEMLAEALRRNRYLTGFTCIANPCDFSLHSSGTLSRAMIASQAPLATWNSQPLPGDIADARKRVGIMVVLCANARPGKKSILRVLPLELYRMLKEYLY